MVEQLLQLLIGVVDTKLFKGVQLQMLEERFSKHGEGEETQE